jgi:hypothetical protein
LHKRRHVRQGSVGCPQQASLGLENMPQVWETLQNHVNPSGLRVLCHAHAVVEQNFVLAHLDQQRCEASAIGEHR